MEVETATSDTAAMRLIASYFSEALPLRSFLESLVKGVELIEENDEASYQSLIQGAWVGLEQKNEKCAFENVQLSESQNESQAEVITTSGTFRYSLTSLLRLWTEHIDVLYDELRCRKCHYESRMC